MPRLNLPFRMPMPVTRYTRHGGCVYAICPRCRIPLDRDYQRFCDRCGQKLDWTHKKYPLRGKTRR